MREPGQRRALALGLAGSAYTRTVPFDASLAAIDHAYLTTTGRSSGRPREIEIWFVARGAILLVMAGGGEGANWVRNLRRNPSVQVRVAGQTWDAWARVVSDPDEEAFARAALVAKYQPGYQGDLSGWGRTALPVALELWESLTVPQVSEIMRGAPFAWRIAGGHAIEAFVGRVLRGHGDLDISIGRPDHLSARAHLASWDVRAADPPGSLRPWSPNETLPPAVHDAWCRRDRNAPWAFQLVIDEFDGSDWVFRRDARVRRPLASLTFRRGGVPFLVPEVQLLFKAKAVRTKDQADFEACLAMLETPARAWLAEALRLTHPGHPWLERL